mmetsp:Transcript_39545/g.113854  ORF Transcript_39545/g.113854 Transcript_39545/m.113854 type:complete len:340 (+) Transcript_39545:143-1162(+)
MDVIADLVTPRPRPPRPLGVDHVRSKLDRPPVDRHELPRPCRRRLEPTPRARSGLPASIAQPGALPRRRVAGPRPLGQWPLLVRGCLPRVEACGVHCQLEAALGGAGCGRQGLREPPGLRPRRRTAPPRLRRGRAEGLRLRRERVARRLRRQSGAAREVRLGRVPQGIQDDRIRRRHARRLRGLRRQGSHTEEGPGREVARLPARRQSLGLHRQCGCRPCCVGVAASEAHAVQDGSGLRLRQRRPRCGRGLERRREVGRLLALGQVVQARPAAGMEVHGLRLRPQQLPEGLREKWDRPQLVRLRGVGQGAANAAGVVDRALAWQASSRRGCRARRRHRQ